MAKSWSLAKGHLSRAYHRFVFRFEKSSKLRLL